MWPDYKLKIVLDKKTNEIVIMGDKRGLEYVSECCLNVIGKEDPSGHYHLMPQFENVTANSIPTVLIYSDNADDYK